jgi:hypothetical protein
MQKSDLQEQLATLYLRLNGYFTSGFIVHAPEGEINLKGGHRSSRAEIDALAVRFPYNDEPEREISTSNYLQTSATYTDFLICEVKGQDAQLQFNPGLRESVHSIHSVLRWAGMFTNEEILGLIEPVQSLLSTQYPDAKDKFRELIAPRNIRIRMIFFAPDRPEPAEQQGKYIHGQEMIDYIWNCLRPRKPRSRSQTRYDFGLWGTYEEVIRFFKDRHREKPSNIQEIYQVLLKQ